MDVTARSYAKSDAQRCCDIINAAVEEMDGLNAAARERVRANNVPDQLDADLQRWTTLVVESADEKVVGLGALDQDELKRIYVDPGVQGHGVATAVMAALEEIARTRGIRSVRLDASPSSVGFYESSGYARQNDDHLEIGDAVFEFVSMTKTLEP